MGFEFDFDIYVKQFVPPHWRDTWKEKVILAALEPWRVKHQQLYDFRLDIKKGLNLNAQKAILRDYLKEQAGFEIPLIYFTENRTTGKYVINVPSGDDKSEIINSVMQTFLIAGTDYEINVFNT